MCPVYHTFLTPTHGMLIRPVSAVPCMPPNACQQGRVDLPSPSLNHHHLVAW